jgi:hypothetical protein
MDLLKRVLICLALTTIVFIMIRSVIMPLYATKEQGNESFKRVMAEMDRQIRIVETLADEQALAVRLMKKRRLDKKEMLAKND